MPRGPNRGFFISCAAEGFRICRPRTIRYEMMKRTLEIILAAFLFSLLVFICRNKLNVFYYNRAVTSAENGSYASAIEYFRKSIALEPSAAAHYGLGNVYLDVNMKRAAEFEFRLATIIKPDFFPAFEALAHLYLRENSFLQAEEIMKEAVASCPGNWKTGKLSDLVKFSRFTDLLKGATDAFTSGDKTTAYRLLYEAVHLEPQYVFTHYLLAYLYFSERNYPLAKAMADKALEIDVKFFPARRLLGDIYFEEGRFENAVAEYNAALSSDKTDPVLLNSAALAYMNLERYDEAVRLLQEAAALNPGNVNLLYSLACLYRDSGRLREAMSAYRAVIAKDTAFPNVHNDLAGVYKNLGRPDLAVAEYREEMAIVFEKLALNPQDPFLLADMAAACNGAGKYSVALDYINKSLAVKKDHPQAYLVLADIQKNLDNLPAAQDALRKAGQSSSRKYSFIENRQEANRGQTAPLPAP